MAAIGVMLASVTAAIIDVSRMPLAMVAVPLVGGMWAGIITMGSSLRSKDIPPPEEKERRHDRRSE